jgi:ADP-ribose pyrophosphatase
MPIKPWKVLETSYFRPRFRIDKCELSNGHLLDATILEFRSWANVVALTKDAEVVLVRQYRHGVCESLLEFPGGVVDDGEDTPDGAKRKLLEETGYIASQFIQVGQFYPNPALQTNTLHCFLALDAGEDIEVQLVPFDELVEIARRGEFRHGLMTAVLFFALTHMNRIY